MGDCADRYSVGCIVCGDLIDEREHPTLPGGTGHVCSKCQVNVVQDLASLCHCLSSLGYSCYFNSTEWIIYEEGSYEEVGLDDALSTLWGMLEVADYARAVYDDLSGLI